MNYQKKIFNFIKYQFPPICCFCVIWAISPEAVKAQLPDLAQNQSPIRPSPRSPIPPLETPLPTPLPPPEQLLEPTTPIPRTREQFREVPGEIVVEEFIFEGNTAFSDEELAELIKSFIGRPLSFSELLGARSAIAELYLREGYITSGAFIPPQSFEDGIIAIGILEGELEELTVTGEGKLISNYVRDRIQLATQKPLNQNRLLQALQLLQLDPRIERISAELSAGSSPGRSFLNVTFRTADTFYTTLFTDNGRVPSVGSWRRGIAIGDENLFGFGDTAVGIYTNTEGSNEIELVYTIPLNARNGRLGLRFNATESEIIESPFDELDIESNSSTYELTYRQPIVETPTTELTMGITISRRESNSSVLGVDFPLSLGADASGRTRLSVARAFQEYIRRGPKDVFAARSQFSVGVGAFDATINDEGPDGEFFSWRGQAQYVRELAENTVFLIRTDIQLTPDALVPLEQMGNGGFESVRGYRQDSLLSDNGVFVSAELRYPILRTSDRQGILHAYPFVDFATGWNSSDLPNPDPQSLVSVGVGLRWEYSDRINARIEWGIPLVETESRGNTWQEDGIYFSVEFTPF